MSYSNGVVLAPVGMGDISSAVGNSSLDIGTLVQATQNSKWQKYKPMRGMNDPGIWQKRGDTYHTLPARLGYNYVVTPFSIGGVSAKVLKMFDMIIPMIGNASTSISQIISYTGASGWNWDKNTVDSWYYYRMLDFDGYKPSAGFPLEYWQNNQEIDPATTNFIGGGRHVEADYSQQDAYRLFAGDLAQAFNNKVVWGAVVQVQKTGLPTYTSPLCYTNDEGDYCYFHEVVPEHGFPNGYAYVDIPLGSKLSNLNGRDYSGGYGKIWTFGYIPSGSGTGYDDNAILLPSNGGTMTTNPASFTIAASSVTDILAQLSFNVSNGLWGRTYSNVTEIFPKGYPGYTLTSGTGIYAGSAFYRSFAFSLSLRNTTSSSLTLNLSRIVWDVSIVDYTNNYASPLTTDSERSAAYYYNNQNVSSVTIAANSTATVYVVFSNLWEDLTASYYNNTGNYAVWMTLEIKNLDNRQHHYTGGTAQFFAKYEDQSSAYKFNWSWDDTGPKKV